MEKVWRINLLGRLSAERGECRIAHFRTNKTGLLLGCLAYSPSRQFRREELVEQLWPEEEPVQGRNNLRVSLSYLRQALEPGTGERGALLFADRETVYLHANRFRTDSAEFDRLLSLAAKESDENARITHLQAAVKIYQADFLTDFDALWISSERGRLADSYHAALASLSRSFSALGEYEPALAAAHSSLQADPRREETHRLVMQILALMGRPHAALRQYRVLESLLSTDSGASPSKRTRGVLADLCKVSGVTLPSTPIISPAPTVPQPESPTASPGAPIPIPIPKPLTPLIGREGAVVEILDLLSTSDTRLITLTGLGGVGKSRLALSVAHRLRRDGRQVFYLPLTGVESCDSLLPRLARVLRLTGAAAEDCWEAVVGRLAEMPAVLILDNLEQLLPDAAAIVRRILETVEALACLVTSRQRLAIGGERGIPIHPLPVPPHEGGPADVARCESVRLWLQRVHAVQPNFTITPENYRAVATLCRRLEGLPLALELAAAWCDVHTPAEVVHLLETNSDGLTSRDCSVAERHTSIRATLDWSCDRLTANVRASFARLAVFPDGWTVEGAVSVTGSASSSDHILALRERSLVSGDPGAEGERFHMLQTVREYALSCLTSAERKSAHAGLVAHYLTLVERAEPELKGPGVAAWMPRLTQESENVRCALTLARDGDPQSALRLSLALYRYWYIRGLPREGRQWLSDALARAGDSAPERPRALMALGNLAYAEGDLSAAESYYLACQALRAEARDTAGLAATLSNLVNIRHRQGDLSAARALAQQSLLLYTRVDNTRGQAIALGNMALVAKEMGDCSDAMELGEQAIDKFNRVSDLHNLMVGFANLSDTALRLNRNERACECLLESLNLCLRLDSRVGLAHVFSAAANLALVRGGYGVCIRLRAAAARLRASLMITRPPDVQKNLELELEELRGRVGDASYDKEWEEGSHLTDEAATLLVRSILAERSLIA